MNIDEVLLRLDELISEREINLIIQSLNGSKLELIDLDKSAMKLISSLQNSTANFIVKEEIRKDDLIFLVTMPILISSENRVLEGDVFKGLKETHEVIDSFHLQNTLMSIIKI